MESNPSNDQNIHNVESTSKNDNANDKAVTSETEQATTVKKKIDTIETVKKSQQEFKAKKEQLKSVAPVKVMILQLKKDMLKLKEEQVRQSRDMRLNLRKVLSVYRHEKKQIQSQQAEFGYSLLANISLLAQIALQMVELYPDASDLSLQISNIIDELGVFAQWLLGREKSNELFEKGKTLTDLFNQANSMKGRNGTAEPLGQQLNRRLETGHDIEESLKALDQDYHSDSEENETQNVTLEDLIAVTYGDQTMSLTAQIKDMINEDSYSAEQMASYKADRKNDETIEERPGRNEYAASEQHQANLEMEVNVLYEQPQVVIQNCGAQISIQAQDDLQNTVGEQEQRGPPNSMHPTNMPQSPDTQQAQQQRMPQRQADNIREDFETIDPADQQTQVLVEVQAKSISTGEGIDAFSQEEQKKTQVAPENLMNKNEERKQMPRRSSGQSKSIAILPLYAHPPPVSGSASKATPTVYSADQPQQYAQHNRQVLTEDSEHRSRQKQLKDIYGAQVRRNNQVNQNQSVDHGRNSSNLISESSIDPENSFQINPSSISILSDNRQRMVQNAAQRQMQKQQNNNIKVDDDKIQVMGQQKRVKKIEKQPVKQIRESQSIKQIQKHRQIAVTPQSDYFDDGKDGLPQFYLAASAQHIDQSSVGSNPASVQARELKQAINSNKGPKIIKNQASIDVNQSFTDIPALSNEDKRNSDQLTQSNSNNNAPFRIRQMRHKRQQSTIEQSQPVSNGANSFRQTPNLSNCETVKKTYFQPEQDVSVNEFPAKQQHQLNLQKVQSTDKLPVSNGQGAGSYRHIRSVSGNNQLVTNNLANSKPTAAQQTTLGTVAHNNNKVNIIATNYPQQQVASQPAGKKPTKELDRVASQKNLQKLPGKAAPAQVVSVSVKNVNSVPPIINTNQNNPNPKRVLKAPTTNASKDISPISKGAVGNPSKKDYFPIYNQELGISSARVQNQPGQFGINQNQMMIQSPQIIQQQPFQSQRSEQQTQVKKKKVEQKQDESKPAKWIQKISNLYLFKRKGSGQK